MYDAQMQQAKDPTSKVSPLHRMITFIGNEPSFDVLLHIFG